jgi:hypothetical protein
MQGPGIFRAPVTGFSATVQPWVVYLPPPLSAEDDEASIPMEDEEASIPTEHVQNGPNLNRTFTVRRKAAKRILPWDLPVDEIQLALPSPQDEDIREAKRPRLETPFPTSTDEATTTNTSHTTTVAVFQDEVLYSKGLHLQTAIPAAAAGFDPMVDTTGERRRWTPEEDVKLISAVTNTDKKKYGQNYKIDWVAISAIVPGRTSKQCYYRWRDTWDPRKNLTTVRAGKWTGDEDKKVKDAVRAHGEDNWIAIAELVPGRTKRQCCLRWHRVLDPSIDRSLARAGKWTADEDKKLKDAVRLHGANNWKSIAELVPGRTSWQCADRWRDNLDPSIDWATTRSVRWTADEDKKLKDAVRALGAQNWKTIAELVPARSGKQCWHRWTALK